MRNNKENNKKEVVRDINELNKSSREVLFLLENKNNKDKKSIEKSYIEKYSLSSRSGSYNSRVIDRVLGRYSKYGEKKKEEVKNNLKEELKKINIDYNNLVNYYKSINKVMSKRNILKVGDIDLREIREFI